MIESGHMKNRQDAVVLVVEDNSVDSLLLARTFYRVTGGAECRRVHSAEEAMRYLEGRGSYGDRHSYPLPSAVVTDLRLPGCSGLEFLSWIRQQPALQHLPVVVVTALGNRDLERAYALGASFYLLKPLSEALLAEVLEVSRLLEPTIPVESTVPAATRL